MFPGRPLKVSLASSMLDQALLGRMPFEQASTLLASQYAGRWDCRLTEGRKGAVEHLDECIYLVLLHQQAEGQCVQL